MSKNRRESWRLLISPTANGARNMAVDEAILGAVAEGRTEPTLRLYGWQPPCLSLGYAQPESDVAGQALERNGWEMVRRPTGGRAILHTDELTYSITAPEDHPLMSGGVLASYRRLRAALASSLEILGLKVDAQSGAAVGQEQRDNPVCFENPSAYEMTVSGRKILGSAQVRRRGAVLQHGTLPLRGDIGRICHALRYPDEASRQSAIERVRARAITLEQALGRRLSWDEVVRGFVQGFSQALAVELDPGELSENESAIAAAREEMLRRDPLGQRRRKVSHQP